MCGKNKVLELLLITNDPNEARLWEAAGVDIIFIDLEVVGKHKRQGHLNTVVSNHHIEDVSSVKSALLSSKLLVRVNPLHQSSQSEIDEVIYRGADIIMLPMFYSSDDIFELIEIVAGRCQIYPLIETPEALSSIESLANIDAVSGFHFGLNDLHLSLGLKFMFEVMGLPEFRNATDVLKKSNKLFGIGGVARLGEGILPAEIVIRENYRLGSQRMILSRSFKSNVEKNNYSEEIQAINKTYSCSNLIDLKENQMNFSRIVKEIAESA